MRVLWPGRQRAWDDLPLSPGRAVADKGARAEQAPKEARAVQTQANASRLGGRSAFTTGDY